MVFSAKETAAGVGVGCEAGVGAGAGVGFDVGVGVGFSVSFGVAAGLQATNSVKTMKITADNISNLLIDCLLNLLTHRPLFAQQPLLDLYAEPLGLSLHGAVS